jgi:hypothetical protein
MGSPAAGLAREFFLEVKHPLQHQVRRHDRHRKPQGHGVAAATTATVYLCPAALYRDRMNATSIMLDHADNSHKHHPQPPASHVHVCVQQPHEQSFLGKVHTAFI